MEKTTVKKRSMFYQCYLTKKYRKIIFYYSSASKQSSGTLCIIHKIIVT